MTNLGLGYFQIGERKKGLEITREVLKMNSSARIYANLIHLYIEDLLYEEATNLMNEAQRLYTNDTILDNSLARLQILNLEYDKARETYKRMYKLLFLIFLIRINNSNSDADRLSSITIVPQIMESNEQISKVRKYIEDALIEMENRTLQILSYIFIFSLFSFLSFCLFIYYLFM